MSRLGECGGGETPHSNALEPLIEQPIAIYFLTVAGWEGANTRNPWLKRRLPDFAVVNSVSPEPILSQEAEPVAHKGDREVCVYVEQVVLCWLLVFVGAGCVCVQLTVKPCFLSGISVLTESIWALGELPSCWVLTCTQREGADEVVHSFP